MLLPYIHYFNASTLLAEVSANTVAAKITGTFIFPLPSWATGPRPRWWSPKGFYFFENLNIFPSPAVNSILLSHEFLFIFLYFDLAEEAIYPYFV